MAVQLATGAIHHVSFTVSDARASVTFYTTVLGFQVAMELPTATLLSNGATIVGLHTAPHPDRAITGDRFDENRVGLDHLAFTVRSRADLEQAVRLFDEHGVAHGEITDLGPAVGPTCSFSVIPTTFSSSSRPPTIRRIAARTMTLRSRWAVAVAAAPRGLRFPVRRRWRRAGRWSDAPRGALVRCPARSGRITAVRTRSGGAGWHG